MGNTVDQHIGKKLSRDIHPSLLGQDGITYLLNGDIQDNNVEQQGIFVQNLPSNKECLDLGADFLGYINLDKDELLLFNAPGLIRIAKGCTVRTIVDAPCFDFKGKIKGRYHYVGGQRNVYWVEESGPIRALNIDGCLPKVKISDCGKCPAEYSDEFDCTQTLYNKKIDYSCLEIDFNETGNIPNGVYQVAIAYVDDNERVSDFFIHPTVIKPFNDKGGNFSLNVGFTNCLDSDFDQFEVVLISHRVDRGTQAQSIGIFDFNQQQINISTLDEARYQPIDTSVLLSTQIKYTGAKFIANNNESLVFVGLEERKRLNGQIVANQIVSKWTTLAVRPEEAHLYPSFNRWEVYPFHISWVFCDGQESRRFLISNNVEKPTDPIVDDENYWENDSECNPETLEYWEINDSSTLDSYQPVSPDCGPIEVASGNFSYWESKDHQYDESFGDFECEKVRYHRFPKPASHGDASALFVSTPCADPVVHLMGVKFENILTPDYCDGRPGSDIVGYKIYVGDRSGQESILSNGLLYNVMYEELPTGEQSMYQNYPFNDLNPDKFLLEDKKNQGNIFDSNDQLNTYHKDRFTYVSPDLQYIKGQRGTEIEIFYESIGKINGEYHETKHMPKYQVLSPLGRAAAQTAGILEADAVLKGEPCTNTKVTEICKKIRERTTEVMDFPINQQTSGNATVSLNEIHAAPQGVGSVTVTGSHNTNFQNTIKKESYSYTTEGDDDCTTPYSINANGVSIISFPDFLGGLGQVNDTCRMEVETNAPVGTVLTVILNGTSYNIFIDENGRGTIQLKADCEPLNTDPPLAGSWNHNNVSPKFSPECECTGDIETHTESSTQSCDVKFKTLSNKPWAERLPAMLYYYSQGREAVGSFLESIISPTNYAIQYTATATHSEWASVPLTRRRIDFQQFLSPNKVFVNSKRFNNRHQSSADYLEIHAEIDDPTNTDRSRILHSDVGCAKEFNCYSMGNETIQAVNYYTALKRRLPNQYGNVDNHQVRSLSCVLSGESTGAIIGGDIYISKHRYTRKFPLFSALPLDLPNNTEFELSLYPNVGFPRFWMDNSKESALEDIVEDLPLVGVLFQDYNLDSVVQLGQCFSALDNLGLEAFLGAGAYLPLWITSLTNGWSNPFKLAGKYYTHVTGIVEYWGESKFIANNREYNEVRSSQTTVQLSPEDIAYSKEYESSELFLYNLQYLWDGLTRQTLTANNQDCCDFTTENRLAYSLKQQATDKRDKWRQLLPNNYTALPTHTGKLTTVKEIDQYNLFIGFEDGVWITQQDDGLLTNNLNEIYLGTGDAFSRRLRRVSDDTTGYGGIIDPESVAVTRYGTFWYDRKRKKFLMYNGQLNDYTNNLQSWLNCWGNQETISVYDNRSDNVYISMGGVGLVFKPKIQDFVSFIDWDVDGFIQESDNFLSIRDGKLWEHNQDTYQQFFGKTHLFEVGVLLKDQLRSNMLQSVDVYAEFYKLVNKNKHYITNEFFTEALVFNQLYSTGVLPVVLKEPNNTLIDLDKDQLHVSMVEDFIYRMNGFDIRTTAQPIYRNIDGIKYDIAPNNIKENKRIQGRYNELRLKKKTNTKVLMELSLGLNQPISTP